MKKAINRTPLIKDNTGSTYVDTVITLLVVLMLVSFALNVFQFFMIHQKLEYITEELLDTATYYGKTTGEVNDRFNTLCEEIGITPELSFEGTDYINTSNKTVQLGDVIRVSVSYKNNLSGMGIFNIPVSVNASLSGLSQKYWK